MTKAAIRAQIAERKKAHDFHPSAPIPRRDSPPNGGNEQREWQPREALRIQGNDHRKSQPLETLSAAAVKKFQTLELFRAARTIGAYMPLADEVDIRPLFAFSSAGGIALPTKTDAKGGASSPGDPPCKEKFFFIPAFDESSGSYRMARMTTEFKKGRFGILEPAIPVFATEDDLDLIIVPGVAFDCAGRRIGRGGGFYDRLLPQYRAPRGGLCFDFQCFKTIPDETHDIRMNFLVTETRILNFAMNS